MEKKGWDFISMAMGNELLTINPFNRDLDIQSWRIAIFFTTFDHGSSVLLKNPYGDLGHIGDVLQLADGPSPFATLVQGGTDWVSLL
jgi:hypothetical protein